MELHRLRGGLRSLGDRDSSVAEIVVEAAPVTLSDGLQEESSLFANSTSDLAASEDWLGRGPD
jgi:hypothetical protein